MTNHDNTENKQYLIHVHYSVGKDEKATIIDEYVPVTEEVYRTYKRSYWNEDKRAERESRCQIGTGKGKTKRCTADCSQCKYFRSGSTLSLERLEEESGHSEGFPITDHAELMVYNELLQELFLALEELDPHRRRICEAIMEGKMDKDIAKEFGCARTTFSSQKQKLFKMLRERLKDYR